MIYIYIHTLYSICRVDTQLDPLVTCGSCAPKCQYIWKRFEDIVKPGRYLTLNEGMLTVSTCSLQAEKATYVSPKDSPCFQLSLLMCMIRSIFLVDFCQRRSLLALRLSCRCLWQVGLGLLTSWIRWQIWTIQLWRVHECHLGIWLWSFNVIYPWWSVSPCYPESSHWSIDINRILRHWRSEMKPAKSIEPEQQMWMCFQKNSLARCTFQLLQDPDISWSPYSRILEAACRDREQRQSGPSITGSFLMRFMMFSFDFKSTQCLKNPKAMGWNLKYHGSVDAAFCVSQLLSSWPHPCAQQKFGKAGRS